jgi:hypothetical protein
LTFDVFTVAWKIICAVNFGVTLYFWMSVFYCSYKYYDKNFIVFYEH